MQEIAVNKAKQYTVPSGADSLLITHEWGDQVASLSVSGTQCFTPDSIGVHKFQWKNGSSVIQTDFYDSVFKYSTDVEFFEDYPELDDADNNDKFNLLEKKYRHIIESYTQQKFGPFINKT